MKRPQQAAFIICLLAVVSCLELPTELSTPQQKTVSTTVIQSFLNSAPISQFSSIYVSDEYLDFPVDSAFIASLGMPGAPLVRGQRSDVWVSYDIVRDGGLLIELGPPRLHDDGQARQTLRFSATSTYGGEIEYRLRPTTAGGWRVVSVAVIWMI
jgi:hypothetical protein